MHRVILYILSLSILFSCKKENENPMPYVPLNITPSISVQSTKALVDGSNITSQTIGIQVTNSTGTALYQSGTDNVALAYSSSWSMANTVYLSPTAAKIYAYSPRSTVAGDFTGIGTLAKRLIDIPSSRVMTNQVDYLWAAQSTSGGSNISSSNASIALAMNHSMAQVAFVIYKDNYSGAGNLSQITITDNSASPALRINTTGTNDLKMSLSDGTISGGEASSSLTVTGINNVISLTSDPGTTPSALKGLVNGYILLAPVSISDGTKVNFTFTIDGNNFTTTLGSGNVTWSKGNQYIYTVKLSPSKAAISNVLLSPWTTNTPSTTNDLNDAALISNAANCYIVAPSSTIKIPVNIKGNGGSVAGTGLSVFHTASSVSVLWETASGLINTSFSSANQTATITTSGSSGNGVIAAKDDSGNILWSWHIWVTNFNPNSTTYCFNPNNNLTFMDRNLGATTADYSSAGCIGLNYQWGRKDPFPVPSVRYVNQTEPTIYGAVTSVTALAPTDENNLPNTILFPLNFYTASNPYTDWYSSNSSIHNINLWGAGSDVTPTAKTIFDPCPAGWRVPPYRNSVNPWSVLTYSGGTLANDGMTWTTPYNAGYWPGTSYRQSSSGLLQGAYSNGMYWTAGNSTSSLGRYMQFYSGALEKGNGAYKTTAYAIRCVKEF